MKTLKQILDQIELRAIKGGNTKISDKDLFTLIINQQLELDCSLLVLTEKQIELISRCYKGNVLTLPYVMITDTTAELLGNCKSSTLNLQNLKHITDTQLSNLLAFKGYWLNLRDLKLSNIQKRMVKKFHGKVINRELAKDEELIKQLKEEHQERIRIRDNKNSWIEDPKKVKEESDYILNEVGYEKINGEMLGYPHGIREIGPNNYKKNWVDDLMKKRGY